MAQLPLPCGKHYRFICNSIGLVTIKFGKTVDLEKRIFMKIHETFLYTEHYRGLNREISFLYLISINVCKLFSY